MQYLPLHIAGLLAAAIWPASALPVTSLPDDAVDPFRLQARAGQGQPVPMQGYNVKFQQSSRKILVKSFDHKATPTLTTTLTLSGHPTPFTIEPSDTAIVAATFTGPASEIFACYPSVTTQHGAKYTACFDDTVTFFGGDGGANTASTGSGSAHSTQQTTTPGDRTTSQTSHTAKTAHTASGSARRTQSTTSKDTDTAAGTSRTSHTSHISSNSHSTSTTETPDGGALSFGSVTATPDPTGFEIGTTTLTPGGHVTVGTDDVSLGQGGTVFVDGAPVTQTTSKPNPGSSSSSTSSGKWTTVSDDHITGLYGVKTLTGLESVTAPTTINTEYIISGSHTTTGPVYVAPGGIVLEDWPPSENGPEAGSGIHLSDPIRPNVDKPSLKCPSILKWLCGSHNTSPNNSGSDVDPDDKPNTNPKDDPNNENHTTKKQTTTSDDEASTTSHSSTSTTSSTTSSSSCEISKTVRDCQVKCSTAIPSGESTATTDCFTSICTTVTGCSATPTTSTTLITSSSACSSTGCPNASMGQNWVFPVLTVDTAGLEKMASSIEAEESSLFAYYATAPVPGASATTTTAPASTSTKSTEKSTASSTTSGSSTSQSSTSTSDSTSSTSHSTTSEDSSTSSKTSSTSSKTSASSTSTSPAKSGAIQIYSQPCPSPKITYFIYEVDPEDAETQVSSPCDKDPFSQSFSWQGEDSTIHIGPFSAGGYKTCYYKATGWKDGALTCNGLEQVKCKASSKAIKIDGCDKDCPTGAILDWICEWGIS